VHAGKLIVKLIMYLVHIDQSKRNQPIKI